MSDRYIESGSDFSPSLGAGVADSKARDKAGRYQHGRNPDRPKAGPGSRRAKPAGRFGSL